MSKVVIITGAGLSNSAASRAASLLVEAGVSVSVVSEPEKAQRILVDGCDLSSRIAQSLKALSAQAVCPVVEPEELRLYQPSYPELRWDANRRNAASMNSMRAKSRR